MAVDPLCFLFERRQRIGCPHPWRDPWKREAESEDPGLKRPICGSAIAAWRTKACERRSAQRTSPESTQKKREGEGRRGAEDCWRTRAGFEDPCHASHPLPRLKTRKRGRRGRIHRATSNEAERNAELSMATCDPRTEARHDPQSATHHAAII